MITIVNFYLANNYHPENIVYFLSLLHILLIMEANTMNPDQTAPKGAFVCVDALHPSQHPLQKMYLKMLPAEWFANIID